MISTLHQLSSRHSDSSDVFYGDTSSLNELISSWRSAESIEELEQVFCQCQHTSGPVYVQRKFGEMIGTCCYYNALLDDADKRLSDNVIKDLILIGLHAGYKVLASADPA